MRTRKIFVCGAVLGLLCAAGCRTNTDDYGGSGGNPDRDQETAVPYDGERADDADLDNPTSDEDIYWEANTFSNRVTVTFNGSSAEVVDESSVAEVHVEGAHAAIVLSKGAEVVVSGSSSDGSLKIYGEKKYQLTLAGLDLVSRRGPAINSQCKKRCFVHLSNGSVNRLKDAAEYSDDAYYPSGTVADDEDRKGCFFGKGHLIFSGTGVLVVEGLQKHGIATDGYMIVRPGTTIAVESAAKNSIHIKGDKSEGIGLMMMGGLVWSTNGSEAGKCIKTDQNIEVAGGRMVLQTTGQSVYDAEAGDTSSPAGIKADGDMTVTGGSISVLSTGKGGKGINVDGELRMTGGAMTIRTTGGKYVYNSSLGLESSPKGIKAEGDITIDNGVIDVSVTGASDGSEGIESKSVLTINGGEISASGYDDGINASTGIVITGGKTYAYSVNNDGIDTNGYLTVTGGLAVASGAAAPEEAFDCDLSSNFKITGGMLVGVSGAAVSPSPTATTQRTLIYNGISVNQGEVLAISDSKGKVLLLYEVPRTISKGTTLFFSSPDLAAGAVCTVFKGVKVASTSEPWHGYYESGSFTGGTQVGTFTATNMITTVGNSQGPGGGPGGRQ